MHTFRVAPKGHNLKMSSATKSHAHAIEETIHDHIN